MKNCIPAALAIAVMTAPAIARDTEPESVDAESIWITSIAPLGEGNFVAGSATGLLLRPGTVSKFSGSDPSQLEPLYEHPAAVWTVATSSDAGLIASADYKGNLVIYEMGSGQAKTFDQALERWCQKVIFSPDDQTVVAGNESGKLFTWSVADSKVSKSVELTKASITSLAFSPSGDKLAVTDGDGIVHVMSWPELESKGVIPVGEETAWCVAFQNESSMIVGSGDRKLYRVDSAVAAPPKETTPEEKKEAEKAKSAKESDKESDEEDGPEKEEQATPTQPGVEMIAEGTDWITRIAVSSDGQIAASEVSGKIHFASGGSVTTIGADSGVWAICFGSPGRLLVGTRKNGIVSAGQQWAWNTSESASSDEDSE